MTTPLVIRDSGPSGGNSITVKSGGVVTIEAGGILNGTATAPTLTLLATTATLADANLQATNAGLNSVMGVLISIGAATPTA